MLTMNIRIGTKVKFLNASGGGIVKEFTDDKIALVETTDGFDMPVLVTDLIVDAAVSYDGEHVKTNADSGLAESKAESTEVSFEQKKYAAFSGKVILALVPENDQVLHVSNFGLYLINDSNYFCNYVASYKDSGVSTLISSEKIEPDTKVELAKYSQTDLSKIKEFRLQGLFYKQGLLKPVEPVDQTFNIEDVSFYKNQFFKENDYFQQKAYLFDDQEKAELEKAVEKLKDKDWSEIIEKKEQAEKKEEKKSPKNTEIEEVDLHIEELVDSHDGMSNGEILKVQLARFEFALETAIRTKTQKIVFIHGVGNGVLKHEMGKKLENEYPDLRYQDASFKEYGYGATMVYLK